MVGKTVWHPAHIAVVVVEDASVALAGPAVVNDDVFPSVAGDPGVVNRLADRRREVLPADTSAAGGRHQVLFRFGTGFLDNDRIVIVLFAEEKPVVAFSWELAWESLFRPEALIRFEASWTRVAERELA